MRRCLLASLSIAIASAAFAHPGHGSGESATSQTWWHFISEPIHALPLLVMAVMIVAAARYARRFSSKLELTKTSRVR